MTRRDLQLAARDKGRPWDLGKDVEQSSVVAEVVPLPGKVIRAVRSGANLTPDHRDGRITFEEYLAKR